ncbi:MAG: hypothetical protein FDW93_04660 [Bergeyella sp.]|nr:hypothetical protein [Bergeyella sp.]
MKRFSFFGVFAVVFFFAACKKSTVDASSLKNFQRSINGMATQLSTLQQVKFREALYIIKTYEAKDESDFESLKKLASILNRKSVEQILQFADRVAQDNRVEWSSKGPPSLGNMNIFESAPDVIEHDPNDIEAHALVIDIRESMKDSVMGAKALLVVPRLVDEDSKPVEFSQASLETILEVMGYEGKIYASKSLIHNNDFKGFVIRTDAFPEDKIRDNKIDIRVRIKTANKDFITTRKGVRVNPKVLMKVSEESGGSFAPEQDNQETLSIHSGSLKKLVEGFLAQVSKKRFKEAYEKVANPQWDTYEKFVDPISGFGGIEQIEIKNMSEFLISDSSAKVSVTFDMGRKDGKTTSLHADFGLKNVNDEWKVISYTVK